MAEKHGISSDGMAWHFQLAELIGCLIRPAKLIDTKLFIQEYSSKHLSFKPGTIALSETSKKNLEELVDNINIYYEDPAKKPNLYEIAYMLATARHESYHFLSGEFFSKKPEVGQFSYFNKYDPILGETPERRARATANGNTVEGDGFKYRGRGCVHLTWKNNYQKAKDHLNVDFVSDPDKAAEFNYSVPIMIWGMSEGIFTGVRLSDHINSTGIDYVAARKIINGADENILIASYASKFEEILRSTSTAPE